MEFDAITITQEVHLYELLWKGIEYCTQYGPHWVTFFSIIICKTCMYYFY